MNNTYKYFESTKIDKYTILQIDDLLNKYPQDRIVISLKNTKCLTDQALSLLPKNNSRVCLRIAGGYDEDCLKKYPGLSTYLINDPIYTVAEIIKIMREIKKIEDGLFSSWSEEQKLLYFISVIRNNIKYHPRHETQPSKDIRSLRGLYSHNTVCAGYALILKELCDRNGIECEFTVGSTNNEDYQKGYTTHAWNIVKIKGNYFPVDLTWNAGHYRKEDMKSIDNLFDAPEFIKRHFPARLEKVQDYKNNLKSIDNSFTRRIMHTMNRNRDFKVTVFTGERQDKTRFTITQVGNCEINGKMVYRYIYAGITNNGITEDPIILYSETNLAGYIISKTKKQKLNEQLTDAKQKNDLAAIKDIETKLLGSEYINTEYDILISDYLFSVQNIQNAVKRKDYYLGSIKKDNLLKTEDRIDFDQIISQKTRFNVKAFRRSNGESFVLQESYSLESKPGSKIFSYDIFEYLFEENEFIVRQNTIYSDADLMNDNRQGLADDFLGRERINRKLREAGGYLGYYSKNGIRTYDPANNILFDRSKKTELTPAEILTYDQAVAHVSQIPTPTPIIVPIPTPTPIIVPTPMPTPPTPIVQTNTNLVDTYRLKTDQIIQDIKLHDMSQQEFTSPGMTDQEIQASIDNINEFGIIGSSINK